MSYRDEFQARLGDIPADINAPIGTPLNRPGGFDTTGTRRSIPSGAGPASLAAVMQNVMAGPLAPYAVLIAAALAALQAQANFASASFAVDNVTPIQLRPVENRTYFLIQNNSAANLYLGIGQAPTATSGLILTTGAVYEPYKVPQEALWVLGSVAGPQVGMLFYANG